MCKIDYLGTGSCASGAEKVLCRVLSPGPDGPVPRPRRGPHLPHPGPRGRRPGLRPVRGVRPPVPLRHRPAAPGRDESAQGACRGARRGRGPGRGSRRGRAPAAPAGDRRGGVGDERPGRPADLCRRPVPAGRPEDAGLRGPSGKPGRGRGRGQAGRRARTVHGGPRQRGERLRVRVRRRRRPGHEPDEGYRDRRRELVRLGRARRDLVRASERGVPPGLPGERRGAGGHGLRQHRLHGDLLDLVQRLWDGGRRLRRHGVRGPEGERVPGRRQVRPERLRLRARRRPVPGDLHEGRGAPASGDRRRGGRPRSFRGPGRGRAPRRRAGPAPDRAGRRGPREALHRELPVPVGGAGRAPQGGAARGPGHGIRRFRRRGRLCPGFHPEDGRDRDRLPAS